DLAKAMKRRQSPRALSVIVADKKLPLGARLRAAVSIEQPVDQGSRELFASTILMATQPAAADSWEFESREDVLYAIEHCVGILGDDALPLLKYILEKNGYAFSRDLGDAFKLLGKKVVPTLISVLEDDQNLSAQLVATDCLAAFGPDAEQAVPALIKGLQSN